MFVLWLNCDIVCCGDQIASRTASIARPAPSIKEAIEGETKAEAEIAIELQPTIVEIMYLTRRRDLRWFLGETDTQNRGGSEVEIGVQAIEHHMNDPAVKTLIVVGEVALGPP